MDGQSRSALTTHFHTEVALIIVETSHFLPQQVRNVSGYIWTCLTLTAIHEYSFLLRMSMKVNEEETILLLNYCFFGVIDFWAADSVVTVPNPIEIVA